MSKETIIERIINEEKDSVEVTKYKDGTAQIVIKVYGDTPETVATKVKAYEDAVKAKTTITTKVKD